MAPGRPREPSIDHSPEYEAFISELNAFHAQRGTNFEPAPKVGSRRVDLLRLYQRVTGDGGYDAVSDTKAQKLAWRKIGQDFNLGTSNLPALAFNLKTAYYRNLAAYEILHLHGRQPPPKEILEDVSAKGGGLLNRTVDNFQRPVSRDGQLGASRDDDDSEGEGQDTPKDESMDIDELSGGRIGRGLRQAPPQRVLFQPDMTSGRQTRQSSGHYASPALPTHPYPHVNGNAPPNGLSPALANYEPRPPHPLSLKPVVTLANNPELFKTQQKVAHDAQLASSRPNLTNKGMMLPGTGFTGPNIYLRALMSLKSGILAEQEYALHHLVRISFERGDKYRFDGFSGLAESLIEKVLEVSSLFADIKWTVVYGEEDAFSRRETLDGLNGTIDVVERLQTPSNTNANDRLETREFSQRLGLINEAALVIRNMVMLDHNAEFLSTIPTVRDALVILLNLPDCSATVELKHYALEIAEQLTRFYSVAPDDPLNLALLYSIDSPDRGSILTALRAISRISMHLEHSARLQEVPIPTIKRLCEWILIEDEELRSACLDFLYQYTAVVENVETLIKNIDVEGLVRQLVRLLLHNAQFDERSERPYKMTRPANTNDVPIPRISPDLIQDLLVYDEPERSSQWLHACFEEDPTGEITQIALWQAYQVPFGPFGHQRPLLPAKDFITNVSVTFANASAQVLPGNPPKFVIRGIRPRRVPVDRQGRAYMRCLWHVAEDGKECGEFALRAKDMWQHVIKYHLKIPKDSEGINDFSAVDNVRGTCRWAGCRKYSRVNLATPYELGMHFKTHLPDTSERASKRQKYNHSPDAATAAASELRSWPVRNTQTDERSDAAGLPLSSALVLRNLARNLARVDVSGITETEETLVFRVFAPIKEQLYYVMAYNQSLREYLPSLTRAIDAGGG